VMVVEEEEGVVAAVNRALMLPRGVLLNS
jgi:hypothetical protein